MEGHTSARALVGMDVEEQERVAEVGLVRRGKCRVAAGEKHRDERPERQCGLLGGDLQRITS